jgi:hypothetical protein
MAMNDLESKAPEERWISRAHFPNTSTYHDPLRWSSMGRHLSIYLAESVPDVLQIALPMLDTQQN